MKKIIATGKGGVGKTTIIATLSRLMSRDGYRVLVIDTDPSMNLAMSLGVPFSCLDTLADHKAEIREQIHADGADEDEKHVHGQVDEEEMDELINRYTVLAGDKVRVMVMGTIPYGGAGCICSSIALVKLVTGNLEKKRKEIDYIIVDSQAGSEVLGRGLAADYDYNLVVTEATPKAVEVARHAMKLASDIGVHKQLVIVSKVENEADVEKVIRDLNTGYENVRSISYDKKVLEADKQGSLILDYAPDSPVIADIRKVKNSIEN